jgi:hypothetical protein
MIRRALGLSLVLAAALVACGPNNRNGNGTDAHGGGDGNGGGDGGQDSYLVYAHSNTVLYTIDLQTKQLVTVGNFNAPNQDVITDLAVAPDGTIYTISNTALYTASASDGHVTKVGSLATCGQQGVALTTTSDGALWMGDFQGAICGIDTSTSPPTVKPPVMMQNNMALAGDMVGIGDGTVFGTAYNLNSQATQSNNILVKVDVHTGAVTQLGSTGYPKLFGASFQENQVFAFTHDGSGHVITIDPQTGAGTLFGTFKDPGTNQGISFAGAGVNSLIVIQ